MSALGDMVVITCGPTLLASGSPRTSSQSSSTRIRSPAAATLATLDTSSAASNMGSKRQTGRGKIVFIEWLRRRSRDMPALPPGPKHRSRAELFRKMLNGRRPAKKGRATGLISGCGLIDYLGRAPGPVKLRIRETAGARNRTGPPSLAGGPVRIPDIPCDAPAGLVHVVVAAVALGGLPFLRLLGDQRIARQEQRGHAGGVGQRGAGDLGRVDHARLHQVFVLVGQGVV